jgi:GR25 family glycosyltransferase involved in LPS biosynthesis
MKIALKYLGDLKNKMNLNISDKTNIDKYKIFNDAFLINLDSRLDRLNHSTTELNKVNIKFSRFPGLIFKDKGKYGSIGRRGCAESHLSIIKNNHNNKNPFLIMEDDIIIADYFDKVHYFIETIPKEWDLLYFYHTFRKNDGMKWLKSAPYGTHFYIVNNKSTDKILNLSDKNNLAIDSFYMSKLIDSYSTSISFVKQSVDLGTDIEYKSLRQRWRYNPFLLTS